MSCTLCSKAFVFLLLQGCLYLSTGFHHALMPKQPKTCDGSLMLSRRCRIEISILASSWNGDYLESLSKSSQPEPSYSSGSGYGSESDETSGNSMRDSTSSSSSSSFSSPQESTSDSSINSYEQQFAIYQGRPSTKNVEPPRSAMKRSNDPSSSSNEDQWTRFQAPPVENAFNTQPIRDRSNQDPSKSGAPFTNDWLAGRDSRREGSDQPTKTVNTNNLRERIQQQDNSRTRNEVAPEVSRTATGGSGDSPSTKWNQFNPNERSTSSSRYQPTISDELPIADSRSVPFQAPEQTAGSSSWRTTTTSSARDRSNQDTSKSGAPFINDWLATQGTKEKLSEQSTNTAFTNNPRQKLQEQGVRNEVASEVSQTATSGKGNGPSSKWNPYNPNKRSTPITNPFQPSFPDKLQVSDSRPFPFQTPEETAGSSPWSTTTTPSARDRSNQDTSENGAPLSDQPTNTAFLDYAREKTQEQDSSRIRNEVKTERTATGDSGDSPSTKWNQFNPNERSTSSSRYQSTISNELPIADSRSVPFQAPEQTTDSSSWRTTTAPSARDRSNQDTSKNAAPFINDWLASQGTKEKSTEQPTNTAFTDNPRQKLQEQDSAGTRNEVAPEISRTATGGTNNGPSSKWNPYNPNKRSTPITNPFQPTFAERLSVGENRPFPFQTPEQTVGPSAWSTANTPSATDQFNQGQSNNESAPPTNTAFSDNPRDKLQEQDNTGTGNKVVPEISSTATGGQGNGPSSKWKPYNTNKRSTSTNPNQPTVPDKLPVGDSRPFPFQTPVETAGFSPRSTSTSTDQSMLAAQDTQRKASEQRTNIAFNDNPREKIQEQDNSRTRNEVPTDTSRTAAGDSNDSPSTKWNPFNANERSTSGSRYQPTLSDELPFGDNVPASFPTPEETAGSSSWSTTTTPSARDRSNQDTSKNRAPFVNDWQTAQDNQQKASDQPTVTAFTNTRRQKLQEQDNKGDVALDESRPAIGGASNSPSTKWNPFSTGERSTSSGSYQPTFVNDPPVGDRGSNPFFWASVNKATMKEATDSERATTERLESRKDFLSKEQDGSSFSMPGFNAVAGLFNNRKDDEYNRVQIASSGFSDWPSSMGNFNLFSAMFDNRDEEVTEQLLDTKGMTERIMKRIASEGQATGAGGATTWEAFQRLEESWARLKASKPFQYDPKSLRGPWSGMPPPTQFVTQDATIGNAKCWAKLREQRNKKLDFDVVVCGGTLGVFFAAALQLKGHRVCVVETGKLRGREQEWNISMEELLQLVNLGVLTEDDINAAIKTEFPGCRAGFKTKEVTPLSGGCFSNGIGFECFTEDVLNLGVTPVVLIDRAAKRFRELGGVIREQTPVQGVALSDMIGAAVDLGMDQDPITARLVVDCMGNGSPITKQQRYGTKPDGICAVVGTCAAGYDKETNTIGDIIYTNRCIEDKGAAGKLQYFWESFPVGIGRNGNEPGSSDVKTTYMFTYMDADERRPPLETLMEDYWKLLPIYQPSIINPERDLDIKRVLFAYFPTYRDSPLKPQWSRIISIGDASGIQSPLSFGGLGALTRHLGRISGAISEALESDLLYSEDLALVNPYTPNLSASWMFQKAMSIRPGQSVSSDFVNRLLAVNFEVMDGMGKRTIKPFLQDVIRLDGLLGSLSRSFIADPSFMPQIVAHVGVPTLIEWLGHVGMMGYYGMLDTIVSPVVSPFIPKMKDARTQFEWRRRIEAWKYGSGNDYILPNED